MCSAVGVADPHVTLVKPPSPDLNLGALYFFATIIREHRQSHHTMGIAKQSLIWLRFPHGMMGTQRPNV